jgi:CIC family chloride channel protein
VALATATATYVGRYLLGDHPAFVVPALVTPIDSGALLLLAYVGLGCVMAIVSALFIRVLYGTEDLFERLIPRRDYLRHVVGMLGVGVLATTLLRLTGHYYVEGVGYATILDILSSQLSNVGLLLALFVLKLLATSITLGSGASGGVFSPSLFMGATLGAAYGIALRICCPGMNVNPAAFALAGMAGLVAGATGAALTAIVMIFEMTLDYSVVLPMTLTAAVAYGLRRALLAESIYTMKLTRRGHYMPQALQANAHLVHHVSDLTLAPAVRVPADPDGTAVELPSRDTQTPYRVLTDGDRIVGVLSSNGPVAFVTVASDATLVELLALMARSHAALAVVVASGTEVDHASSVLGVITQAAMTEALAVGMELFGD